MVIKKFNSSLWAVSVELDNGSSEYIGVFKNSDIALQQYVDAVQCLKGIVIDFRCVELWEELRHPQYKMIRIR